MTSIASERRALPMAAPRALRAARVSLTDRCDFACVYCRPAKTTRSRRARLDLESWRVILAALLRSGLRTVRFTGGEPLIHPGVVELVRVAAELGFPDIALTTNATRLERLAAPLRAAGLRRLNVSLDTLDAARFEQVTRGGRLDRVLCGIDAARAAGFEAIKCNTVVMRGVNDDELERLVLWAWDRGITPRFIELMPIGVGAELTSAVVHEAEMVARLEHLLEPGTAAADEGRGPARYLRSVADPTRRVGFITGRSRPFCDTCDRLRVTSDGLLLPCLAVADGVAAYGAAIGGDVDLAAADVRAAWRNKPAPSEGCLDPRAAAVSMCGVGG